MQGCPCTPGTGVCICNGEFLFGIFCLPEAWTPYIAGLPSTATLFTYYCLDRLLVGILCLPHEISVVRLWNWRWCVSQGSLSFPIKEREVRRNWLTWLRRLKSPEICSLQSTVPGDLMVEVKQTQEPGKPHCSESPKAERNYVSNHRQTEGVPTYFRRSSSGLQLIRYGPSILRRAICLTKSTIKC